MANDQNFDGATVGTINQQSFTLQDFTFVGSGASQDQYFTIIDANDPQSSPITESPTDFALRLSGAFIPNTFSIQSTDGSEFKLDSLQLYYVFLEPMIIEGLRDGQVVIDEDFSFALGTTGSISYSENVDAVGTLAFTGWDNIDAIRFRTQTVSANLDLEFDDINVSAVPNIAPTISNTTANQNVNDTATITPFSTVEISDAEDNPVTVTVALDVAAKGVFTAASLTASGFTDNNNGTYTLASTTAAATTAIRQLVFDPTDNRVAAGLTETTTFTITVNDGTTDTTDSTTTVVSTSINDAPTATGVPTSVSFTEDTQGNLDLSAITFADAESNT
ncbi:hypothetical protein, partial [Salinarimonas ramus]|uniref:hypothetical protein n=1 Tax=Salinarimonas ramus TaxID=690164 RepID=UPI0016696BCE